jgi:hypothetical protein
MHERTGFGGGVLVRAEASSARSGGFSAPACRSSPIRTMSLWRRPRACSSCKSMSQDLSFLRISKALLVDVSWGLCCQVEKDSVISIIYSEDSKMTKGLKVQ